MRPYLARPIVRTRFQSPVAYFPNTLSYPVFKTREVATHPSTNIMRMENGFKLQMAIPGIPKEQIQLQMIEDQLVVSATNPNQETGKNFVRQEFDYGSFKRSFNLHKNADMENMKASFENGILTIVIPDKAPETKKIEIQ